MEKIKNLNYKLLFGNLILIIAIIMFVSLFSKIFGMENNFLGVGVITAILMCSTIDTNLSIKDSVIAIMGTLIVMSLSAFLGRLNLLLGIFVNFTTVFFMIYIFSKKIDTIAFLPFILCFIFLESNPITIEKLPLRIIATFIGGILIALSYYLTHKNQENVENNSLYKYLTSIKVDSLQFNFALRMAIGITITTFLGNYFGFTKYVWLSFTVMSLTQPHLYQTKERIKYRVFGTFLGSLIFVLLFNFLIPKSLSTYGILFLNYLYTFFKEYKVKIIFTTINSLGSVMIFYDMSISVSMRISFILIGTVIAFIVNKGLYDTFINNKKDTNLEILKI